MKYKRKHRRPGEISLACHMMRRGMLDVCLDCGAVYTTFRGRRRKRKPLPHYKGYLWVTLQIEDKRRRPDKQGRRVWRMSAWIHRIAYMKKVAVKEHRKSRIRDASDWKSFVVDISPALDIDHKNRIRIDNRGKNLILRTHAGNSGRRKMTPAEEAEIEAERIAFMGS